MVALWAKPIEGKPEIFSISITANANPATIVVYIGN